MWVKFIYMDNTDWQILNDYMCTLRQTSMTYKL